MKGYHKDSFKRMTILKRFFFLEAWILKMILFWFVLENNKIKTVSAIVVRRWQNYITIYAIFTNWLWKNSLVSQKRNAAPKSIWINNANYRLASHSSLRNKNRIKNRSKWEQSLAVEAIRCFFVKKEWGLNYKHDMYKKKFLSHTEADKTRFQLRYENLEKT